MRQILIALMLLAGCTGGGGEGGADGNQAADIGAAAKQSKASSPGALKGLSGLYEGGEVRPPNQMCIVERGSEVRFGLVVWGSNLHSCSGSGTVARSGDSLQLRMAGDSACTIDATISGDRITLPASVPQGCAYYCGERASLTGTSFTQRGTSDADAAKAKDLVGDPLCAGG